MFGDRVDFSDQEASGGNIVIANKVQLNKDEVAILTAIGDFPLEAGPISYTSLRYIADTTANQNDDDETLMHWAVGMTSENNLYKGIDYPVVLSVDHEDDPQCYGGNCYDISTFHYTF